MNLTPSTIKLHRTSCILEVAFGDQRFRLPAEYLRVYSPSAEVKGHGPGEEVLQLDKENVAITGIEPQGNYAIKLIFSDGHDSGIYSWHYLHELGTQQEEKWQEYLARVEAHKTQSQAEETAAVRWITPE
ncbi:gamma-butyrobetaine hydroxylase-like domain-containing protein [Teredinibacter haidensis]|uniref:gamma-butyrobetaine hydroxylase-like domain-containing protein n=1 Tax=Teredinibacter haidensis TaxID=2731755 RepID=UPI000948C750|nr:DUF971 domain-containing protein [Teredinibacter haidensis]